MTATGPSVRVQERPPAAAPDPAPRTRPRRARTGRAGPLALAGAGYLALAVALWWQVWSQHPTATTTCGCGDAALFLWFLAWPAHAIAHGHNPFFSTALFHPVGINLLSNTSVLLFGVLLAPVTWLWGPVATLNVASTLCPALSALAMFWLLRRWVTWTPAAFAAGLLYGFSPLMLVSLAVAHLMTAFLVVPPLVVACLDELLVRRRRRPAPVGLALGLLLAVQFFAGTEELAIIGLGLAATVVGAAVVLVGARPADLAGRLRHAGVGLGTGAVTAGVLLAYPAWFALAGRAHLAGPVWPDLPAGYGGAALRDFWQAATLPAASVRDQHLFGGYQGPALPQSAFLGLGLLVVCALGVAAWWRDRRQWCFVALFALGVDLSLSARSSPLAPWRLLAHVPVVKNIIPERVVTVALLAAAVLLGLVLEHVHAAVAGRGATGRHIRRPARALPAAVGLAVAAVALWPVADAEAANLPLTAVAVVVPRWFATAGPRLPTGQVVLAYPAPFSGVQAAMAWQAVTGLPYAMAGGGSPEGVPQRAGPERPGFEVISALSLSFAGPPPAADARNLAALRQALVGWGVTRVVEPLDAGLPRYDRGTDPAAFAAEVTLAVGAAPVERAGALVWGPPVPGRPARRATQAAVDRCVLAGGGPAGPASVPACVLAASVPEVAGGGG